MRQINKTQRRLAAGAFLVVAAPVVLTSVSYACGGIATLHANPLSAAAGSTVELFGKGYSDSALNSNIEIRLNDRNGPVLQSIAPTRVLTGSLVLPAGTAVGEHTVIATQFNASGVPISGTPGRATVKVTAAPLSTRVGAVTGDQAAVVAPGSSASSAAPAAAQVVTAPAAAAAAASATSAAPASAAPSASVATPVAPAAAAPVAAESASASVTSDTAAVSTPAANATAAPSAAAATSPATAAFNGSGLVPVSSDAASNLPALALAGGLALMLLSLAAFFKSGRNMLGGRGFTPLAR